MKSLSDQIDIRFSAGLTIGLYKSRKNHVAIAKKFMLLVYIAKKLHSGIRSEASFEHIACDRNRDGPFFREGLMQTSIFIISEPGGNDNEPQNQLFLPLDRHNCYNITRNNRKSCSGGNLVEISKSHKTQIGKDAC